ncbi:MAG: sugar transferase [Planctomycetota bacterium]
MHTAGRIAAAAAAFGAAWWLRFQSGWLPVTDPDPDLLPARYIQALPVALLATLVAARAAGLRHAVPRAAPRPALREFVAAATLSTLLLLATALLTRDMFQYSRGFLLLFGTSLVVFLPAGDIIARAIVGARRTTPVRVLLVGGTRSAAEFVNALARGSEGDVEIVGRAGPEGDGDAKHLGALADVPRLVGEHGVHRVIVMDDVLETADAEGLFRTLGDATADVGLAWRLPRPSGFPSPELDTLGPFAVAAYWESPLRGSAATLKRLVDVLLSLLLIPVLAPVMLVIALLVKLTSRGPVLHLQDRVGLDGQTFTMWKFRTMIADAESGTGPVFASPDDPRTTGPGRLLRRFSLDELPQIANVLRGDMSLVGPRPERPEFVEQFRQSFPGYMLRHSLKAGITGWAQVNGLRGRSSIEDRLAYDLEYARHWSLLFDLEILVRTVFQVLAGRNAY